MEKQEIQKQNSTTRYDLSEEDFQKLADVLRTSNFPSPAKSQLQEAVRDYHQNSVFISTIPREAEVKAALVVIRDKTKALIDSLETLMTKANSICGRPDIVWVVCGTKIKRFRFHDIRTTVKTNMLRARVDKVLRDTILGHSLKGMDAFYLKPTEEDLTLGMARYTQWIDFQSARVDQNVDQTQKEASPDRLTP